MSQVKKQNQKSKALTKQQVTSMIETKMRMSSSSQKQRSANKMSKGLMKRFNRIQGSERLFQVPNPKHVNNVDAVYAHMLDHDGFNALRVSDLFPMYEYYFVHSLRFQYVPYVAKTTAGSVFFAPEWDPLDATPNASDPIPELSASYGFKSASVNDTLQFEMTNFKLPCGQYIKQTLFTGPLAELRLSSYGKIYSYIKGLSTTTQYAGELIMHYDITFCLPQKATSMGSWTATSIDQIQIISSKAFPTRPAQSIPQATSPTVGTSGFRLEDGGTPVQYSNGRLFKAVLAETTGNAQLADAAGRLIEAGTELYFQTTGNYNDTATGVQDTVLSSAWLGNLALDPEFNNTVTITGDDADLIQIASAFYM